MPALRHTHLDLVHTSVGHVRLQLLEVVRGQLILRDPQLDLDGKALKSVERC